jgi:hypothetical protein
MAPAIATPDMVWDGASYPKGAGPDRTPNTFGAFALEIETGSGDEPPAAPKPPPPPPPSQGSATKLRPQVRCRATRTRAGRPRTTCAVTRVRGGARVIALAPGRRRIAAAPVRGGRSTLVLPRRRRTVTFKVVDSRNRELGRSTRRVP